MTVRLGTKLIANTGSGGSGGGTNVLVDNITITKDDTDVITTVAIDNKNDSSDILAVKTWMGTLAEYEAIENKSNDIIYYITDDETLAQSANINLTNLTNNGEAKLGDKRNIGEKVTSFLPVKDACLHLADGTLITYGIYKNFVDYMANLYNQSVNAQYFVTEDVWQNTVVTTGECDKFVYDSVNKTVRLPKVNGVYIAIATLVKTPTEVSMDEVITEFDNKASVDLDNLSEVGEKHFLNKSQITNCLLEVPQRVKLELNNGVLTLKAGSEVIVPNGFEADGTTPKFDYVTVENDATFNDISNTTDFYFYSADTGMIHGYPTSLCFSGATEPSTTSTWVAWYDTSLNTFKFREGSTSWIQRNYSLPICIATADGTNYTSIDQIFNGMGYIGSTVWVDKGVKGLIPYGRNEDGSLKNIEYTNDTLKVRNYSSADKLMVVALRHPQDIYYNDYPLSVTHTSTISQDEYMPSGSASYLTEENIWRGHTSSVYYNLFWVPIGSFQTDASGMIFNFQPKLPFRAVDYSDGSTVSGWSMPSSKYTDLTLGASGSTYTAPANGYFCLAKSSTGTGQFIFMGGTGSKLQIQNWASATGYVQSILPVLKGTTITINYTTAGSTALFRFIYAQGEV